MAEYRAARHQPRPARRSLVPGGGAAGFPYELTRRELEVLDLVAAGHSNNEVGEAPFVSKKTVSVHVANIKGKLGAESRVEIVTSAQALGLVEGPLPAGS